MNNPSFQKNINTLPAIGISGRLASLNPTSYFIPNPMADEDGVTIGSGVFYNDTSKSASNTKGANDVFIGFAIAEMAYTNNDMQSGAQMTVSEGQNITVMTKGDIMVQTTNAPAFNDYVFVSETDGTVSTNSANTAQAGHTLTNFRVIKAGSATDVSIISNQHAV